MELHIGKQESVQKQVEVLSLLSERMNMSLALWTITFIAETKEKPQIIIKPDYNLSFFLNFLLIFGVLPRCRVKYIKARNNNWNLSYEKGFNAI